MSRQLGMVSESLKVLKRRSILALKAWFEKWVGGARMRQRIRKGSGKYNEREPGHKGQNILVTGEGGAAGTQNENG